MAKRPIRRKQANRLRKAMRRTPDQFIDPVRWLIDHNHARTKREARELILAGRLRAESHKVGFQEVEAFNDKLKGLEKRKIIVGVPLQSKSNLTVASA
jgi:hypothetical protein